MPSPAIRQVMSRHHLQNAEMVVFVDEIHKERLMGTHLIVHDIPLTAWSYKLLFWVEMLSAFRSPVLENWLFASFSLLLRIAASRRYGWSPIVVPVYIRDQYYLVGTDYVSSSRRMLLLLEGKSCMI